MASSSWRTLSEMELHFARSRRRAASRRLQPRAPARWKPARALLVTVGVAALVGVIAADAQTPAPKPAVERAASNERPCPVPARFRAAFTTAAAESRVPLSLLVAIAYEESRMDPDARSRAGAHGLLQLLPTPARELDAAGAGPSGNVRGGARYLRRMLDRFGGDVDLALAAYNAGPGAVERAGGAPTLETLAYVENVKGRAATLADCR